MCIYDVYPKNVCCMRSNWQILHNENGSQITTLYLKSQSKYLQYYAFMEVFID